MKKIFSTVLTILSITLLFAQDGLNKLDSAAKEMKFVYKIPAGSEIMPSVKQEDVLYFIGFSNDNGNIEYRIAAYPPGQLPDQPGASKEELKNSLEVLALAVAMNITQDENIRPDYYYFNDADVKEKFGGDLGFYFMVDGNSHFSKGYKYVLVNFIYKKNCGIIITYILFNDVEYYLERFPKNTGSDYCLKFLD